MVLIYFLKPCRGFIFSVNILATSLKPTQVILDETPVTWEWHYPIRSALWLTPVLFVCKIFYFIGIYPYINVQLLLRIFTAILSAYAESKFLDFTFRMFQIFEISSNYFYLSLLSWLRFSISAPYVRYGLSGHPARRTHRPLNR